MDTSYDFSTDSGDDNVINGWLDKSGQPILSFGSFFNKLFNNDNKSGDKSSGNSIGLYIYIYFYTFVTRFTSVQTLEVK